MNSSVTPTLHRQPRGRTRGVLAALALTSALVLSACGSEEVVTTTPDEVTGGTAAGTSGALTEITGDNRWTPSTTALTSTAGGTQALGNVGDDADLTLVFFGYTHCPDVCGTVMSNIASGLRQLDATQRDRVEMVFVTTDPARDDVPTLTEYLDRYDPEFVGLTGEMDDILEVGSSMKIHIEQGEKLPSGGYEVIHNDHVLALDDEGRGAYLWGRQTSASELAGDLTALLER